MAKSNKFSENDRATIILIISGLIVALAAMTQSGSLATLFVIIGAAAFILGIAFALLRLLGII